MKELRLKVKDKADYNLLVRLAKRLDIELTEVDEEVQNKATSSEKMAEILDEIAADGGISIEDPSQWQKNIRKDRQLF